MAMTEEAMTIISNAMSKDGIFIQTSNAMCNRTGCGGQ
jgi:hypothetical protein